MNQPLGTPLELDLHIELRGEPIRAGRATFTTRQNRLVTTLRYERDYLARPGAYAIDPSLPLDVASHFTEGLPSALADSAPDWWGRNLIARRARAEAAASGRQSPIVTEVDYLLGVSDATRQGALRLSADGVGEFLAPHADVPRLVELGALLDASEIVLGEGGDEPRTQQAVKTLLAAGTGTLGGARPKASVTDDGRLYLAKFPHPAQDEWDVIAWEKTALDLAEQSGLPVPNRRLIQVDGRSVLLLERFDRTLTARREAGRVGYISAATLIGGNRTAARDYLDLQAAIEDHSGNVEADLLDLYRRIVFSVVIHNTDDHMRNTAFLRAVEGWRLSPVFDVNPDPEIGRPRATALLGETMPSGESQAVFAAAPYFGLSNNTARDVFDQVSTMTANWREVAVANGVSEQQLERFVGTLDGFRH